MISAFAFLPTPNYRLSFIFHLESHPNHLNFGNCYVGAPIIRRLLLNYPTKVNNSDVRSTEGSRLPTYHISWPLDHPHLEFEPNTCELHPDSSVAVFVKFRSDEPVEYQSSSVCCKLVKSARRNHEKVSLDIHPLF